MASGLDLVARKSLERSSEASILISCSSLLNHASMGEDDDDGFDRHHWSWKHLRNQFCEKSAEPMYLKYQSRLQHTFFMIALMVNSISGIISILILWFMAQISTADKHLLLAMKCVSTSSSLLLYVVSYRESWFAKSWSRLVSSVIIVITTVIGETGTSIAKLVSGSVPRTIFSSYPLLIVSVFLPFPKWYQLALATFLVALWELSVIAVGYQRLGLVSWKQITTDVICHVALGLLGLYMRFLMEFRNRKAFLDRRECFENKFHLKYEQEQEERLLLSVLPKHISEQVRGCIRDVIRRLDMDPLPQRPFTELFVEKHHNVSILYADMVNSVALTASLNVADLVETLNELFGRFDDSAERNSCLRIKLLGDCYYCVSGMPDTDPLHADHCVQMGLDIIDIIRCFRDESRVNVDMRIGVHSGNVLSGLLGLRKWQFDIWSRDVTIASRMEQSGRPGSVHVSRATKDLLQSTYNIEPGNGNIGDEYLEKYNMETFFITPAKKIPKKDSLYISADRTPTYIRKQPNSRIQRKLSTVTEVLSSRRRTVLGFSLLQFRLMKTEVNKEVEAAIHRMALSKKDQWFHSEGIQPFLLTFRRRYLEKPFLKQKDPLFGYSLIGAFFTACVLTAVSTITKPRLQYFWAACCVAVFVCLVSIVFFWISIAWSKLAKMRELPFLKILQDSSSNIIIRVMCFSMICILLMAVSLMGMEGCGIPVYSNNTKFDNATSVDFYVACQHPMYFTWYVIIVMISISLFLRVHFLLKLLLNGTLVTVYSGVIWYHPDIFETTYLQDWTGMHAGTDQWWSLVVTWFLLHLLDRQLEYIGRLVYLWKRELRREQQEASLMNLVNKTLLRNILPEHVAKYYLDKDSMHLELELYHEDYTWVAVMFASIPNYMDFYSESLFNDEGRKCIQVLHEIICDFDKLMYESPFLKLEKIKTIGSTYMVAAGLQPGRNSSRTSYESTDSKEDPTENVHALTKFAFAMIDTLGDHNRNCWQNFKLRIGIAVGPVVAGVVGSSKPQYDIWGDTVNIASRMDSTGIVGEVQVTEIVGKILRESAKYELQCRGQIFVKGKGWMTTYLVRKAEETKL